LPLRSCTGEGELSFWEALDCSSSSSRVVFHPSRGVLPTAVVIYYDRSSPTLSSTMSPLRLHLQTNVRCAVICLFIMFYEYHV
jgi:hypothetical protein